MQINERNNIKNDFKFDDLVDVTAFNRLLESFFRTTGIPNGLVGPDGEIISQAGWVNACALFHRVHPNTNLQCQESNLELMQNLHTGEIACSVCKNGLIDYATPVVIEGRRLATLFLGQVLNHPADLQFFRNQANRFGFEETEYIEAIRAVPVVSKTHMDALMSCMVEMAQMLAASGLARLKQATLEQSLSQSTEERIQLEDLLKLSPVGIGWSDRHGKIEYINRHFIELFGYTLKDLPDLETWYRTAYPDPDYRETVVGPWIREVSRARRNGKTPPELEANVTCKDHSVRRVLIRVSWVGEKRLVNFSDITDHWRSEQRNHTHDLMLEMVARGARLPDILNAIVLAIEAEEPTSLCSILLADENGEYLSLGAAPNLPQFFTDACNGLKIGMGVGSYGTAAHLGKRVIVTDIETHEYRESLLSIAKEAGLRSCWSEPIVSSSGTLLGTFEVYHTKQMVPTPEDLDRVTFAATLAAIAIENRNTREKLLKRERTYRTLAENAPVMIARFNGEGRVIYVNPRLADQFQIPIARFLGQRISDLYNYSHAEKFQEKITHTLETGEESSFETETPGRDGNSHFHLIHMVAERDDGDRVTGVLATGQDITERKRMEEELERQAHYDYLTELCNRRYFIKRAENELSRVARYGGELSLIMFDIDHFKLINDTHGHNTGDLVLQKIAAISRDALRKIDIIGRIGGEEFVILLPGTGKRQAIDVAERLRATIEEGEIHSQDGIPIRFTASFGVASLNGTSMDIDQLLILGDAALYRAKESGRNRVCLRDD